MFFHSMSVKHRWTQVPVGCLGNEHKTILRATLAREEEGRHSKGKSHQDPVVNLIKCDESQKTTTLAIRERKSGSSEKS